MTIEQLIEKLKQFDPKTQVFSLYGLKSGYITVAYYGPVHLKKIGVRNMNKEWFKMRYDEPKDLTPALLIGTDADLQDIHEFETNSKSLWIDD